jgi:hypothetical protein
LRRKFDSSTHWSASFRELRSGLTAREGNNNVSDSFNTNFSWGKYSVSGYYSKAKGEALLGANGTLTPTPLGSVISSDFITYNARSLSISTSAVLFRRLVMSGGYTKVSSSTVRRASDRFNNGHRFTARLAFRIRQIEILAGFNRAVQESSAAPVGQRAVNSYYVSLSRWFNVF